MRTLERAVLEVPRERELALLHALLAAAELKLDDPVAALSHRHFELERIAEVV